ncbi:MAG: nucleoside triphosphate pyrophosphohydrolase [Hyphomicrobiaceae bacterium]
MTDNPAEKPTVQVRGDAQSTQRKTIGDLVEVMKSLRTPVTGCPWDLEQSFTTIAPYTIEEAYEVADAIARGDMADLEEELGDLLLQVVYHARMAEEQGLFDFHDVAHAVTRKMIRRHPHVFGTPEQRAAGAPPDFWARIKAEEKAEKAELRMQIQSRQAGHTTSASQAHFVASNVSPREAPTRETSLLADVPLALPALSRAIKLQDKAARVGFDWPSIRPVFDKMREELIELEEVSVAADPRGVGHATPPIPGEMNRIKEELGDLLFVMANVARHLKLDPEEALRGANEKFSRRFLHIEQRLAEMGKSPAESDLQEMDALWDEARAADKSPGEKVKKSER